MVSVKRGCCNDRIQWGTQQDGQSLYIMIQKNGKFLQNRTDIKLFITLEPYCKSIMAWYLIRWRPGIADFRQFEWIQLLFYWCFNLIAPWPNGTLSIFLE